MPSRTCATPVGTVVWFAFGPHCADGLTSRSGTLSLGLSFTGHERAVTSVAGAERQHTFPPDTAVLTGDAAPVDWLRVAEPSEGVELYPTTDLLRALDEESPGLLRSDDGLRHVVPTPPLWARFARLRSLVLAGADGSRLEAPVHDATLELALVAGRRTRAPSGRLGTRELRRVIALLHDHVTVGVTLDELASAIAMSPYHLLRAFRASTGLTPHGYLTAIRLSRARRALAVPGARVADVARDIGYTERQLRRAHRAAFGSSPTGRSSQLPRSSQVPLGRDVSRA